MLYSNPRADSPFRLRATHLDGTRAAKVVLCNDPRIQPGQLCRVRVPKVLKPEAKGGVTSRWSSWRRRRFGLTMRFMWMRACG